jgi:hypothetical protein
MFNPGGKSNINKNIEALKYWFSFVEAEYTGESWRTLNHFHFFIDEYLIPIFGAPLSKMKPKQMDRIRQSLEMVKPHCDTKLADWLQRITPEFSELGQLRFLDNRKYIAKLQSEYRENMLLYTDRATFADLRKYKSKLQYADHNFKQLLPSEQKQFVNQIDNLFKKAVVRQIDSLLLLPLSGKNAYKIREFPKSDSWSFLSQDEKILYQSKLDKQASINLLTTLKDAENRLMEIPLTLESKTRFHNWYNSFSNDLLRHDQSSATLRVKDIYDKQYRQLFVQNQAQLLQLIEQPSTLAEWNKMASVWGIYDILNLNGNDDIRIGEIQQKLLKRNVTIIMAEINKKKTLEELHEISSEIEFDKKGILGKRYDEIVESYYKKRTALIIQALNMNQAVLPGQSANSLVRTKLWSSGNLIDTTTDISKFLWKIMYIEDEVNLERQYSRQQLWSELLFTIYEAGYCISCVDSKKEPTSSPTYTQYGSNSLTFYRQGVPTWISPGTPSNTVTLIVRYKYYQAVNDVLENIVKKTFDNEVSYTSSIINKVFKKVGCATDDMNYFEKKLFLNFLNEKSDEDVIRYLRNYKSKLYSE